MRLFSALAILASLTAPALAQSHYYDFEVQEVGVHLDQQLVVPDGTAWSSSDPSSGTVIDVYTNPYGLGYWGLPGSKALYLGPPGSKIEVDLLRPSEYFAFFAGTGDGGKPTHVYVDVFDTNGKQILHAGLKVMGNDQSGQPGFLLVSCNTSGGGAVFGGMVESIPHPDLFFYAAGTSGLMLTGLWINGPSGFPIGRVMLRPGSSSPGGVMLDDMMFNMPDKLYPGPGHDLAITTRINGSHMAGESKLATAGDTVWVDFWSPMSKYDNQPFACIAQAYPEGAQPGPMPGLPEVLVNPTAFPPPLVLFGDFLTPGGVNPWSVTLPSIGPGWPGALGLQGLAFAPDAPNGMFVSTDMVELTFP